MADLKAEDQKMKDFKYRNMSKEQIKAQEQYDKMMEDARKKKAERIAFLKKDILQNPEMVMKIMALLDELFELPLPNPSDDGIEKVKFRDGQRSVWAYLRTLLKSKDVQKNSTVVVDSKEVAVPSLG